MLEGLQQCRTAALCRPASIGADRDENDQLVFDPAKRCSMEDALLCDYMAPLHQGRPLPTVEKHFSFQFEKPGIKQAELRDEIWAEMLHFHPEAAAK